MNEPVDILITKEKQEIESFPVIQAISNEDEYEQACSLRCIAKDKLKVTEQHRKDMTEHLVKAKRVIDDKFKTLSVPLESFVKGLDIQINIYYNAKQKEALLELQRQRDENTSAVIAVEAPRTTIRTAAGVTSIKKFWTFQIEDEEKIPDKYFTVNEKFIQEAINEGARNIPGIKIYQDTQIASR